MRNLDDLALRATGILEYVAPDSPSLEAFCRCMTGRGLCKESRCGSATFYATFTNSGFDDRS